MSTEKQNQPGSQIVRKHALSHSNGPPWMTLCLKIKKRIKHKNASRSGLSLTRVDGYMQQCDSMRTTRLMQTSGQKVINQADSINEQK
jgi:hypothetical protein